MRTRSSILRKSISPVTSSFRLGIAFIIMYIKSLYLLGSFLFLRRRLFIFFRFNTGVRFIIFTVRVNPGPVLPTFSTKLDVVGGGAGDGRGGGYGGGGLVGVTGGGGQVWC